MADIAAVRPASRMSFGGWSSQLVLWGSLALALMIAPQVFSSSAAVSLLSQLGTLVIFCLSYNMLLGEGGMYSFGHAAYSGLGAYFAIHAMNMAAHGKFYIPVWLIPLVGGIAGMVFGILFGYLTTRKAGTAFAMITLGVVELVHASSEMFPGFFGGEGGVETNRNYGSGFFGMTFGPQIRVYYLIVAWLLLSAIAMYALTRTPLGRIMNAVRDNAERAQFVGYDPKTVRFFILVLSAFFAGISGGLQAINMELITSESVSSLRSGDAMIFTFIGGAQAFFGPIIGVLIGGFLSFKLSDYTQAWQLYLGIFFILIVMYAPTGVSGILLSNWRVIRAGLFGRVAWRWSAVVCAGAMIALAGAVLIELSYGFVFGSEKGAVVNYVRALDKNIQGVVWGAAIVVLVGGIFLLRRLLPPFKDAWNDVSSRAHLMKSGDRA